MHYHEATGAWHCGQIEYPSAIAVLKSVHHIVDHAYMTSDWISEVESGKY